MSPDEELAESKKANLPKSVKRPADMMRPEAKGPDSTRGEMPDSIKRAGDMSPDEELAKSKRSEFLNSIRRQEEIRGQKIAKMADRFDAVAGDAKYQKITSLHGFTTLRLGLREYALPPRVRQGRIFANHLDDFKQAMEQKKSGASWKAFFEMDQLAEMARSKQELKQADREFLAKMLGRFDTVSQDPEYDMVKNMQGFKDAHNNLKSLLQATKVGALEPAEDSSDEQDDVKKSSELKPQEKNEGN